MPVNKFEPFTQPLTEKEMALVPATINAFKFQAKDKGNFLSAKNMMRAIESEHRILTGEEVWIKDAITVRKIVNYLVRTAQLEIASSWHGYYLITTPEEFDEEIESLENRSNALKARIEGLKELKKKIHGQ